MTYHNCTYRNVFAIAADLAVIVGCWIGRMDADEFVLARDGQPAATIVTAAAPTDVAAFSAQELQYHVQKITGAILPIKSDADRIEGPKILVGFSNATTAIGLKASQFKDQEYLVRCADDTLTLVGQRRGGLYAVYDFLERFCNVRWYGPGQLGMVAPKSATLGIQRCDIRRHPAFAWRAASPHLETLSMARVLYGNPSAEDQGHFWTRLRLGGEAYSCNHSLYGYYDRFWRKNSKCPTVFEAAHPDWFAKGYSENELKAGGGRPPQMCFSNQSLVAQVVADARKFFDGHTLSGIRPELRATAAGKYFAVVPMDAGWCKCAACQAQMDQEQKKNNKFFSNGIASDYWFTFINKVAREVAKSHPGRYIATLAYADYAYYPRHVKVEPNVSIQMCLHTRNWWSPGMEENDRRFYGDWVKNETGRPLYLWNYYLFPEFFFRDFHCFPGFHAHTVDRQIKMFARDGIRGVYVEGVSDQLDTYITFRLLDDPSLNVDVLLEEFFTRYYGAAAEPMKRLYLRIEEIYSNPSNYPEDVQKNRNIHFHQTEEMAWKYLGTETRMAELGALMDEATRATANGVEKQRVALFRKAVWDHMVEGRKKYLAKQKTS